MFRLVTFFAFVVLRRRRSRRSRGRMARKCDGFAMRSGLKIGPTPYGEECAQVGASDYDYRQRAVGECAAFIRQLKRHAEANGVDLLERRVDLRMNISSHDAGNGVVVYYEVFAFFDDDNELAVEAAYWLECSIPKLWDRIARGELGMLDVGDF